MTTERWFCQKTEDFGDDGDVYLAWNDDVTEVTQVEVVGESYSAMLVSGMYEGIGPNPTDAIKEALERKYKTVIDLTDADGR